MKIKKILSCIFVFLIAIVGISTVFMSFVDNNTESVSAATTKKYYIVGEIKTHYEQFLFGFITITESDSTSISTFDNIAIYGSSLYNNETIYGTIFLNDSNINIDLSGCIYSHTVKIINKTTGTSYDCPNNVTTLNLFLSDGIYYLTDKYTVANTTGTSTHEVYEHSFISYDIVIDTTAPSVSVSNVTNGGFTNKNVVVSWNNTLGGAGSIGRTHADDEIFGNYSMSTSSIPNTATTAISNGQTFSSPGHYRVQISDKAGNTSDYTFTIDKTAPAGSLSGVANSGFTNSNVSFSWNTGIAGIEYQRTRTEDTISAYYSISTGTTFPTSAITAISNGQSFSNPGHYLIKIQDSAGNYTNHTFTIDKTAPTGSLSGVANSGFTNSNVSFSWNTDISGISYQRTRGEDNITAYYSMSTGTNFPTSATTAISNGQTFSNPGHYIIKIQDSAGNYTNHTFTIDKTAPSGLLSGVADSGFAINNVSFSWGTGISGINYQRTRAEDNITAYYSMSIGTTFPMSAMTTIGNEQTFSYAGHYLIKIQDSAGNYTNYTFTIDKTAPIGSLSGVSDGGFTNSNVLFLWDTEMSGIESQSTRSTDILSIQYRRSTSGQRDFSGQWTTYNTQFEVPGDYQVIIQDQAGNYTQYTFTIDKTAPTFNLLTSDNTSLSSDNRTKATYIFCTWQNSNAGANGNSLCSIGDTLTAEYSYNGGGWNTYEKEQQLTQAGSYVVRLTDKAGNYTEKSCTIDRTIPVFNVINRSQQQLSIITPYYNEDVTIVWQNSNYYTTINGQPIPQNPALDDSGFICAEGSYNIVVTDDIGNRATLTITIIKHAPTTNFDRLKNYLNVWYETVDAKGTTLSFATYDDCYNYSKNREESTRAYGTWTTAAWDGGVPIAPQDINIAVQYAPYILYKAYDNPNEIHAYFNVDTLNRSIEHYIEQNLKIKYIPSTPVLTPGQNLYRDMYYSKAAISFTAISNTDLYIDGQHYTYPYTLSTPGIHLIREQDFAGNYITYTVVVDTAAPMVRATDLTNNNAEVLSFSTSIYKTNGLKIWLDDLDPDALLTVSDGSKSTVYIGQTVELRTAGVYTISVRDAAGNTGSLIVYISLTVPTITITDNVVNDLVTSFNIVISKNSNLNNFSNVSIQLAESGAWKLLDYDNASIPIAISPSNLSYLFDKSGTYKIIIVDVFGRWIEQEYSFVKSAPKGFLQASNGSMLNNGDTTRYNVSFTWSTALTCTATLNGEPYFKNTTISVVGSHVIVLKNNDGGTNVYTFTIDKTAPVGKLYYINNSQNIELENGKTVKYDVFFTWADTEICTAFLDNEAYLKNSTVTSDGFYTIKLVDLAGNQTVYTFTIKKTLPKGYLYTTAGYIDNGAIINKDVYFSWTENNCSALLNAAQYNKDVKISSEGTHTILLTDAYGNTAAFYFTIDKTAPTGSLWTSNGAELTTESSTRFDVRLTWTETNVIAIINNTTVYTKDAIITMSGNYTIVISDIAGNKTTYNFTIKKAAPVGTIKANGETVKSGSTTRFDVTFSWTETGCTATLNGVLYTKNDRISVEEYYIIILTDSVGNTSEYTFTIDKTAPVSKIFANGEELISGSITRFNAIFTWAEIGCTATLNGTPYISGTEITQEGEYTLKIYDTLGNGATYTIIINRTAKTGTLISNYAILENNTITRYNVYFTWNDSKSTATLNGEPYDKGNLIINDGEYIIILTDNVGNTSQYGFAIDKTSPDVSALRIRDGLNYQLENNALINNDFFFTWTEAGLTATLNGQPYLSDTVVSVEGLFVFSIVDFAGNITTFTLTVDKTAPVGKLYDINGEPLENSTSTRFSIYFTWQETSCTAMLNGQNYDKNNLVAESGEYTLTLIDRAGNVSEYTFIIDKEIPQVDIYNLIGALIVNDSYVQDGIYFNWNKENCTATLNGEPYINGTEITQEGEYFFVLTSHVGNQFSAHIVIDRTPPSGRIMTTEGEILSGTATRSYVTFSWTETGCTATVNGTPYISGTEIFKDGNYTVRLVDRAGNYNDYTFTVHRTLPTGIIVSLTFEKELFDGATTTGTVCFISFDDDCEIYLDNAEYVNGMEIDAIGSHNIIIRNAVGGERTYSFTIREISYETQTTFSDLFKGSDTGTIVFGSSLAASFILTFGVPFFNSKRSLKQRIKKI
jgi:hypothetical protein